MSKNNEIAIVKKDVVDVVQNKIQEFKQSGELKFPANYSPENAMKSAWLKLQTVTAKVGKDYKPALEVCTKDSIANTLLDMVVQGLSPAKSQCYFIAYGGQLQLQRSYFGTMAVTKRLNDVKDIRSQVIYQDDIFEMEINNGVKTITKHVQNLMNIDVGKIIGAYTVIEKTDGSVFTEIMNINQIKQAWRQSKQSYNIFENGTNEIKGDSVHGKFTDQMVLKTVINRACKTFANTSDDSDLLIESFNRSTENEFEEDAAKKPSIAKQKEKDKENEANQEDLDFDDDKEIIDVDPKEEADDEPKDIKEESKVDGPDF